MLAHTGPYRPAPVIKTRKTRKTTYKHVEPRKTHTKTRKPYQFRAPFGVPSGTVWAKKWTPNWGGRGTGAFGMP